MRRATALIALALMIAWAAPAPQAAETDPVAAAMESLEEYMAAFNARDMEAWPNVPSELLEPGKFNAPHGMAADSHGSLYVVEWMIGGRITKLVKR